ncbi:UNVERIFIED_CONTAM: Isoprene synthase, chloroplastic [Sesamum latifolium]|uniref:Isoprene synthase, chloroplastic n=1 Tax=Sesamum latifolium TaxID=2727402 RepID=A0AAW2Y8X0_9LAMI
MLGEIDNETAKRVRHALELPLYHKMQRVDTRWNIEMYDKHNEANHVLHTMAILDFNMVQSVYQQELQQVSRWWTEIGLANKFSFARNRLMECFFWAIGMVFEPQHSKGRTELTKVAMLVTVLDDVYDVYGSLEELGQFTDAVERWDINAVNYLPHYMKLAFLALYNTINNIAYGTLKEQDYVIIPQLQKVADIEIGKTANAISCYMHETGETEEVARAYGLVRAIRMPVRNQALSLCAPAHASACCASLRASSLQNSAPRHNNDGTSPIHDLLYAFVESFDIPEPSCFEG